MKKSKMLLFAVILAGCGQTGPLQLPQSMPQATPNVTEASDKPRQ